MHGMAKVKASEAEKEKKRKEKELKGLEYREGMKKILDKRKNSEMDEEALTLMSDILVAHPDVYTLWNFRKEILLKFKEEKSEEELTALVTSEMRLTEICLRANPKSYSAWYHRLWLLNNLPKADLETELMICNKYLKLDSRNFHCWDYRREVVTKLGISQSEELNYTLSKIEENFSNYSSWQYRSKLLSLIYKDPTGVRPVKEEIHVQELELVQNAAFTDPTDSSAWFYLRWLLGHLEPLTLVISCYIKDEQIFLAFNKSLKSSDDVSIQIEGRNEINFEKTPQLWIGSLSSKPMNEEKITFKCNETHSDIYLNKGNDFFFYVTPQFEADISPKLLTVLNDQLESCNQLLELEPDSKWTLLTSTVLMQAMDKSKYKDEIFSRLSLLSKVDYLRSSYYNDTGSRFLIERRLEEWKPNDKIDLSNLGLTGLYHTQYLSSAVIVDLSNNKLKDKSLPLLSYLANCEILLLNGNNIQSLEGFPTLKAVKKINISNNQIEDGNEIFSYLPKLEKLEEINVSNNPFIKGDTVFKQFPGLSVIYKA